MSSRKTWYTVAALVLCASLAPRMLLSQPTAAPRMANATLLKRVAEAVDSKRNGEVVFVVADQDSSKVDGTFDTRAQAEAYIRSQVPRILELMGPYKAKADLGSVAYYAPAFCIHNSFTSMLHPKKICNDIPLRLADITSMSLQVKMRNGSTRTISLPAGTDAIFLSWPAMDKFVFPYYERVMGLDATYAWRKTMLGSAPH